MDKLSFINFLEDKLYYLVENIRNEEIEKYSRVIDNYVSMGQSEENAVESFGDPEDLVKAIYLSHGLDYKKLFTAKLSGRGIKNSFKNFFSIITGNDKKKLRNALFNFLYIIVLIILLKIVFIFVRDLGSSMFADFVSSNKVGKIYDLSFEILYVLVALIVFIKMFTKRFSN